MRWRLVCWLLLGAAACASGAARARPEFTYVLDDACRDTAQNAGGARWDRCDLERSAKTLVERAVNGHATDDVFSAGAQRVFLAPPVNKTAQQLDGAPFNAILARGFIESRRAVPTTERTNAEVIAQVRFEQDEGVDGSHRFETFLSLERVDSTALWKSSYIIKKAPRATPEW